MSKRVPTSLLFDQLHVDISVKQDLMAVDEKDLNKFIKTLPRAIERMIKLKMMFAGISRRIKVDVKVSN